MFEKENKNKGASLVLVIISMLFIGIIVAAVITLTSGNISSNKTNEEQNANFYGAEKVVDYFTAFLQQIANNSAAQAYEETLVALADGDTTPMDELYQAKFVDKFAVNMGEVDTMSLQQITNGLYSDNGEFAGTVEAGMLRPAFSLEVASTNYDKTSSVIQDIKLAFRDEKGYETVINFDIPVTAAVPNYSAATQSSSTTVPGATITPTPGEDVFVPGSELGYNIDKFIIISDGDILPGGAGNRMSGSVTGNVYAKGNFQADIPAGADLSIYSQKFITGGNVDVKYGSLYLRGMGNTGLKTDGTEDTVKYGKKYLDLDESGNIIDSENKASVWVGEISLDNNAVVQALDNKSEMHLKDDISLNGNATKFVAKGSDSLIRGFSYDNKYEGDVTNHKESSAITLVGTGASLDLTGLKKLQINGTAYTQVPEIAGTSTDSDQFFVQGESITYKSLQTVYLIPGDALTGVGHNPMTQAEYNSWSKTVDTTKAGVPLASTPYRFAMVKYTSTATPNVYIYWNFSSMSAAIQYFNNNFSANQAYLDSKIGMLKDGANGYIKLNTSADAVHSNGNIITYNGSSLGYIARDWNGSDSSDCITDKVYYNNILKSLDETQVAPTNDLFSNLFFYGDLGLVDSYGAQEEKELVFPESSSYKILTGTSEEAVKNYKLIVGNDVKINSVASNTKYIVISTGDVEISTNFTGLVIAKGDVKIGSNVSLSSLGNAKYTKNDGSVVYTSEFAAILSQVCDNDSDISDGNTLLRSIFGVQGSVLGSGATGPTSGSTLAGRTITGQVVNAGAVADQTGLGLDNYNVK